MIGLIKGQLLERVSERSETESWIVYCGGAIASGVGYLLRVPSRQDYQARVTGESVTLWVHTHVREEALELFGFDSATERAFFGLLISVSGIGPKTALAILSQFGPEQICRALIEDDRAALSGVSGVGKKLIERLFVELADRVRKEQTHWLGTAQPAAEALPVSAQTGVRGGVEGVSRIGREEARQALASLGFGEAEFGRLWRELEGDAAAMVSIEAFVRRALTQPSVGSYRAVGPEASA